MAAMVAELTAICSSIGSIEQIDGHTVYRKKEESHECLLDLVRVVRNDSSGEKLALRQLGEWHVLQKDLLPMFLAFRDEKETVFSITKILVLLTFPEQLKDLKAIFLFYQREYKRAFINQQVIDTYVQLFAEVVANASDGHHNMSHNDNLFIELVLTLFRNLLAITDDDRRGTSAANTEESSLQERFLKVMLQSQFLDLVVALSQSAPVIENKNWIYLLMEILTLTFRGITPAGLVKSAPTMQDELIEEQTDELSQLLQCDKAKRQLVQPPRHSRFGGFFWKQTGKVMTTNKMVGAVHDAPARRRRTKQKKQAERLITDTIEDKEVMSQLREKARQFLKFGFFAVVSTTQPEVERHNMNIQEMGLYISMLSFFLEFHFLDNNRYRGPPKEMAPVIKCVWAALSKKQYHWVFTSLETAMESKLLETQALVSSLLRTMIATLEVLLESDIPTFTEYAYDIREMIFCEREIVDILVRQWRNFDKQSHSRRHLRDIILNTHTLLRMGKRLSNGKVNLSKKRVVARKANHDMDSFFTKFYGLISNQHTVQQYLYALQGYESNPVEINHAIIKFFHSLINDAQLLAMFYHIEFFQLFTAILSDASFITRKSSSEVVDFAKYVTRRFVSASAKNPLVFAEALFWRPPRICHEILHNYDLFTADMAESKKEQEEEEEDGEDGAFVPEDEEARRKTAEEIAKELFGTNQTEFDDSDEDETLPKSRTAKNWKSEEDDELKALFEKHRLEKLCFDLIAAEMSTDRTASQVQRRAKVLGLARPHRSRGGKQTSSDKERRGSAKEVATTITPGSSEQVVTIGKKLMRQRPDMFDFVVSTCEQAQVAREQYPEADYCVVPKTETEWKSISNSSVQALMKLCLFHLPVPSKGQIWWRLPGSVPLELVLAHLKKAKDAAADDTTADGAGDEVDGDGASQDEDSDGDAASVRDVEEEGDTQDSGNDDSEDEPDLVVEEQEDGGDEGDEGERDTSAGDDDSISKPHKSKKRVLDDSEGEEVEGVPPAADGDVDATMEEEKEASVVGGDGHGGAGADGGVSDSDDDTAVVTKKRSLKRRRVEDEDEDEDEESPNDVEEDLQEEKEVLSRVEGKKRFIADDEDDEEEEVEDVHDDAPLPMQVSSTTTAPKLKKRLVVESDGESE